MKLPSETAVVITDISPYDGYYCFRDRIIGKYATTGSNFKTKFTESDWWSGVLLVPGGFITFYKIKIRVVALVPLFGDPYLKISGNLGTVENI